MATVPVSILVKIPNQGESVVEVDTTGRAPRVTGLLKRTWFQFFQALYTRGFWTPVEYSAGLFTASGAQTWTVQAADQTTFSYAIVGKTLMVAVVLASTTVGGTPSPSLRIALPTGFTAATAMVVPARITDNGTVSTGYASITAGGLYITVQKIDGSNWTASTNATGVAFVFPLEVQG